MRQKIQWVFGLVVVASIVASAGCGSSVYPVRGTIMFEGKPMAGGGSIAFVPTDNRPGKRAGGIIAEDGTYELMTHKPGDGSMTGEYMVVITQSTSREPEAAPDGKEVSAGKIEMLAKEAHIPSIYSSLKSPLRATVEAKTLNEIDLQLKRSDQPQNGPRKGEA